MIVGRIIYYGTNEKMISRQQKNIYFSRIKNEMNHFFLQVSEGLVLRDGTRLKYPINGNVLNCL